MKGVYKLAVIGVAVLLLHAGIAGAQNPDPKRQQLLELKQLFEEGLISKEVYEKRQQQVLGGQVVAPGQPPEAQKNQIFKTEGLPPIDLGTLDKLIEIQSITRADRVFDTLGDFIVILYKGRGLFFIQEPFVAAYDGEGIRVGTERLYMKLGGGPKGAVDRAFFRVTPILRRAARIQIEGGPPAVPASPVAVPPAERQPPLRDEGDVNHQRKPASAAPAQPVSPSGSLQDQQDERRLACEDNKMRRERNCMTMGNAYTPSDIERATLELRRERCMAEAAQIKCD
jgi:hypothetical protein